MVAAAASLEGVLACPRCGTPLRLEAGQWRCPNTACALSAAPFPMAGDQPVLVDFAASILDRAQVLASGGASVVPRGQGAARGLKALAGRLLLGGGAATGAYAQRFLAEARALHPRPRVLVVGGGTVGTGADALYAAADVELVAFDVYRSAVTSFVADGHAIPLAPGSVHGVWIQAVLEHVVDPRQVVAEIHRVLAPGGVVYAEVPFMQPVHEGAYDFTRFSALGLRWLFRDFAELARGPIQGAGSSLIWAWLYAFRTLTGSRRLAGLLTLPLFWLRALDRVPRRAAQEDAAAGLVFLGRRSAESLPLQALPGLYRGLGVR